MISIFLKLYSVSNNEEKSRDINGKLVCNVTHKKGY